MASIWKSLKTLTPSGKEGEIPTLLGLQEEVDKLRASNSELSGLQAEWQSKTQEAIRERDATKTELTQTLALERQHFATQISTISLRQQACEAELLAERQRLALLHEANTKMAEMLRERDEMLNAVGKSKSSEMQALESQIQRRDRKLTDLEEARAKLAEMLKSRDAAVDELRKSKANETQDRDRQVRQWELKLDDAERKLNDAERRLSELEEAKVKYAEMLKVRDATVDELRKTKAAEVQQREVAEQKRSELEQKRRELEQKQNELEAANAKLSFLLKEREAAFDELQKSKSQEHLERALISRERKIDELEEEMRKISVRALTRIQELEDQYASTSERAKTTEAALQRRLADSEARSENRAVQRSALIRNTEEIHRLSKELHRLSTLAGKDETEDTESDSITLFKPRRFEQ